ncbi:hypothetical protein BJX66DRAFT_344885 [Aspergillus keveii]|uniref:DUF7580 domain-containing protein n=1 Tax=Aspergillus keveii TaxID=714993 RepID=A0ABR4FJN9_9EURO
MPRPQVRGSPRQKKVLRAYQTARRHARALYNSIVLGHCWKCLNTCQHSVHFQLDLAPLPSTGTAAHATSISGHTLILSASQVGFKGRWYEITAEPYIAKLSSPVQANEPGICPTNRGRVRFLSPEDSFEPSKNRVHGLNLLPIENLCLSLRALDRLNTDTGLIGYISDVSDKTNQYNMRLLRDYKSDIHTQSLHEILQTSHSSFSTAPKPDTIELCRRDRLFLAAILASAVFQLQGSWLKQNWSSHDIQFANILTDGYSAIKRPYLSWKVSGPSPACLSCQSPHNKATGTLLPLAISLIELSLGGPISALQQYGDGGLTQIETTVKILDKVQQESGSSYSDVVKECLYWSRPGGLEFGNEKFDERFFDAVVSPLLRNFCSFEGLSYTE